VDGTALMKVFAVSVKSQVSPERYLTYSLAYFVT
jgi:hypothetical protein